MSHQGDLERSKGRLKEQWAALTNGLQQAAEDVIFNNPRIDSFRVEAEGLEYLIGLLTAGAVAAQNSDPAYPELVANLSSLMDWGFPCPDTNYLYAPVHGDYSYRLSGLRGNAYLFDVQVYDGDQVHLVDMHVCSSAHEFEIGTDGKIEIQLSREKREGNWVGLPPGTGYVCLRQYFLDWETAEPAQLVIEREEAVYPRPPLTLESLAERQQLLIDWIQTVPALMAKGVEAHYADAKTVPFVPITLGTENEFSFVNQHYGQGHYHCGPDEAVIIQAEPPRALYWNFMLAGQHWESMDWRHRPTSINFHEAVLDNDGLFRAVIAHRDPGVPNWLDTAGHTTGLIVGRYYRPEDIKSPTLQVVPLDQLHEILPAETPRVTPAERSESLRRRALAARRRYGTLL